VWIRWVPINPAVWLTQQFGQPILLGRLRVHGLQFHLLESRAAKDLAPALSLLEITGRIVRPTPNGKSQPGYLLVWISPTTIYSGLLKQIAEKPLRSISD
jgi:hypothetical protein